MTDQLDFEKEWLSHQAAARRGDVDAAKEWLRFPLKLIVEWITRPGLGREFRAEELKRVAYGLPSQMQTKNEPKPYVPPANLDEYKFDFTLVDEGFAKKLIERARGGDADAHQAVCYILCDYVDTRKPMPEFLEDYLALTLHHQAGGLRPPATNGRGWDPDDRIWRDIMIRQNVAALMAKYGLSRTRNPATSKPCACSLVAEVLSELGYSISEKTVAEITKGTTAKSF